MEKHVVFAVIGLIIACVFSSCALDRIDSLLNELDRFANESNMRELRREMNSNDPSAQMRAISRFARIESVISELEQSQRNMSARQLERYTQITVRFVRNLGQY